MECRRVFYQSPGAEATALTEKDSHLSYPGNEVYFRNLDANLFTASPPSPKTAPHHTVEASYLVKEDKVYQRIAEVYQPPMKKQSIQIQLSRRRWATIHNFFSAPIRAQDTLGLAPTEPGKLFLAGGDLSGHCVTSTS